MSIAIVEPPAIEPVSLAAAKLYLRVDHDAEDALISDLVRAARDSVEAFTGRALITRRVVEARDGWTMTDSGAVRLALAPVAEIHAVRAAPATGAMVTLDATTRVDADAGLLWFASYVAPAFPVASVEVEYTAGYGETEAACPAALRQAVLVTVAALYETRDGAGALPDAARVLATPFARVKL